MMGSMKILIQRFYVVQLPMHPIDSKFHNYKINC